MATPSISTAAAYFAELRDIHATGAGEDETSFYASLANLLNAVGHGLDPKVRCVLQLKDRGAGKPDGGLFTAEQFRRRRGAAAEGHPLAGQPPARGVIEVKSPTAELNAVLKSEQVEKYWSAYGLILVTNYRHFAAVGRTPGGKPALLEQFVLAESAADFWRAVAHPQRLAEAKGERFIEYLRRAMLSAAPLSEPRDLAWFLGSYARDARSRLEAAELPALVTVRKALEQALGVTFTGPRGEHLFRSTLVQTLFYGVFAAWVLWCRKRHAAESATAPGGGLAVQEPGATYDAGTDRFHWQSAAWSLHVPMIRTLFEQLVAPSNLQPLGLAEVMDWTAAALNRVEPAAFFASFDEGQAVQYFYEPFLEAFDPGLRKELGVWYTPTEIVRYMVARVDTVLREELGLASGLANPRVVVLDPCCGTGAYLVEVLQRIAANLRQSRGDDALIPHEVKRAAAERVFGFEIMPAPFVIAHLQLGLFLRHLGAPLADAADATERAGVFLTNALTGWEPPNGPKGSLPFPEFEAERARAEHVKREAPILVILGNPPYNGYAGMAVAEERELSNAYREARRAPQPQGQGLNDLYVRFFRMAERRIVEKSGQGVVCFISNYSWLDGLSFPAMREQYLDKFDKVWIDNLNGDKYRTGKLTPDGEPDPSVFSTERNREGIQVGTAVALLVRRLAAPEADAAARAAAVRYRDLWGRDKRAQLVASLQPGVDLAARYREVHPQAALGFPFAPAKAGSAYLSWPLLPELLPVSFPGVKTSRDQALVDIDRDRLEARMRRYFDPAVSDQEIRASDPVLMESTGRFRAGLVRQQLQGRGFLPQNLVRYCYRPLDLRWLYWEPETKLLDEKRTEYRPHVFPGNVWLEARQRQALDAFDRGYTTQALADNFGNGLSNYFPLLLRADPLAPAETGDAPRPNLADSARAYLAGLGLAPEALFYHAIAVLHAPAYRTENAGALRQDWPRVPLPAWERFVVTPFPPPAGPPAAEGVLPGLGKGLPPAAAPLSRESPHYKPSQAQAEPGTPESRPDPNPRAPACDLQPRTPDLPVAAIRTALLASAALGRQVAALLDPEAPVPGVTTGDIRPELRPIAIISRTDGKPLNPTTGDLALTAGWGHAGVGGVVMPARGRVVFRPPAAGEVAAGLGTDTADVFLNDHAFWRNVPREVWEFTLGGYQVMKKWLSYRERDLLGRDLQPAEAHEVTAMARRLAALVLLRPQLDANYRSMGAPNA